MLVFWLLFFGVSFFILGLVLVVRVNFNLLWIVGIGVLFIVACSVTISTFDSYIYTHEELLWTQTHSDFSKYSLYEHAEFTVNAIHSNEWLADARLSRKKYGWIGSYPKEVLYLEFITIPEK